MNFEPYVWTLLLIHHSIEIGENPEKEAEQKTEEPQKKVEVRKPSKAKKERKTGRDGGFELWTELDVQRNKFMVLFLHFSTSPEPQTNFICF